MGMSGLPEMYTCCPRAAGPWAKVLELGVKIERSNFANVTLSHLKSKEFQRIHMPYISPQGYICIYTSVYTHVSRESGYISKGASHFHQSKNCLDVDGMSQFI